MIPYAGPGKGPIVMPHKLPSPTPEMSREQKIAALERERDILHERLSEILEALIRLELQR
jgi:hypothetical protein